MKIKIPLVRRRRASALRCGAARDTGGGRRLLDRDGVEACGGGWGGDVDTNGVGNGGVAFTPGDDADTPSDGLPAFGNDTGGTPVS